MAVRALWCLGVVVVATMLRSIPVESQCTARHCYNDDNETPTKAEMALMKEEIKSTNDEMASMKEEMASVKEEIASMKEEKALIKGKWRL